MSQMHKKQFYIIGGVAALLQLATILTMAIVMGVLGPKPASAEEYFAIYQHSALESVLRGDFFILILIALYLGTFPALYVALRDMAPVGVFFATLLTIVTAIGAISTDATFSLLHLGDQYVAAATAAQRAQLVAAGEAVIASDLWNSSAGYVAGIFLQGSGVLISLIMLRSKDFSKVTAYAGLLGNALDLVQHTLHPFVPVIMDIVAPVMGVFYLVWYPMLARDLLRLARKVNLQPPVEV